MTLYLSSSPVSSHSASYPPRSSEFLSVSYDHVTLNESRMFCPISSSTRRVNTDTPTGTQIPTEAFFIWLSCIYLRWSCCPICPSVCVPILVLAPSGIPKITTVHFTCDFRIRHKYIIPQSCFFAMQSTFS